jgi:hypothetical protein
MDEAKVNIEAKMKFEVAQEYNVNIATLRAWIKRAGLFPNKNPKDKYFTPLELEAIYSQFGSTFKN